MIKQILLWGFALILFTSCFEKDERVNPYPGEVAIIGDNINEFTSYFDFETGRVVAAHKSDKWQLGFEASPEGWHIIVNSGSGWFLMNTHQENMSAGEDEVWRYDIQSSYPDSTAAGNWTGLINGRRTYTNDVYVLGRISSGRYIERKLLKFLFLDSMVYKFYFTGEENNASDTITIEKIDSVNFVYFDFGSLAQYNPEPDKQSYDIIFSSYYDLATQFGITIPYLVRGALINTSGVTAAIDSVNPYPGICFENLDDYRLTNQRDVVGYRWKDVSVNPEEARADYTIRRNYSYIIKTIEGNFYKMRFLSFSLNGVSGHPVFEFEMLAP